MKSLLAHARLYSLFEGLVGSRNECRLHIARSIRPRPGDRLLDIGRLGDMLRRIKGSIVHKRLDHISPLAVPMLFKALIIGSWVESVVGTLRWAMLWVFAVLSLTVTYRFAPVRKLARWRWVTWGSVIAATLWVTGSLLFAFYLRTFGSYAQMYGALGGVVVLLMWFYLSSFFVVLGAEINAEMERQTRQDTTEGVEVPMGQRGAHAADSVGPCAAEMAQAKPSL